MSERAYDLGLTHGTAQGIQLERERIIKLLEDIYDYPPNWDYDNPIDSVIALIKGEKK